MDDRRALEEFCAAAHPRLVGALSLKTGDRFLAEELAQEALLRACQRWDYVRNLESPGGWCYRVAVNLGSNVARRLLVERRARARQRSAEAAAGPDLSDRVAVREALLALTSKQRDAVILRYYLGLSAEESGAVLRLSAPAVRALTHRALATLGAVLGEDDLTMEAVDEA